MIFFTNNRKLTSKELDSIRHDPLIYHAFSKKEFINTLQNIYDRALIGEEIQIIVSNKIKIFQKTKQGLTEVK